MTTTLRRSAVRGIAAVITEIREERSEGGNFTAGLLAVLLVACVGLIVAVAVLAVQGLVYLVVTDQWATLAVVAVAAWAVRLVWRISAP